MTDKTPTKRALTLRLRAARVLHNDLPDRVRTAYGETPGRLANIPTDDPNTVDAAASARAFLVQNGFLTQHDLDALPIDEAIANAQQRARHDHGHPAPTRSRDR